MPHDSFTGWSYCYCYYTYTAIPLWGSFDRFVFGFDVKNVFVLILHRLNKLYTWCSIYTIIKIKTKRRLILSKFSFPFPDVYYFQSPTVYVLYCQFFFLKLVRL